jgi:hypothetical protein
VWLRVSDAHPHHAVGEARIRVRGEHAFHCAPDSAGGEDGASWGQVVLGNGRVGGDEGSEDAGEKRSRGYNGSDRAMERNTRSVVKLVATFLEISVGRLRLLQATGELRGLSIGGLGGLLREERRDEQQ